MNVAASCTFLTGVVGRHFKECFACPVGFVLGVHFQLVPTDIEDGFIQSGLLAGVVFLKPSRFSVLLGLGFACHRLSAQVLKHNDFGFRAVHQLATGLVAKILANVA